MDAINQKEAVLKKNSSAVVSISVRKVGNGYVLDLNPHGTVAEERVAMDIAQAEQVIGEYLLAELGDVKNSGM